MNKRKIEESVKICQSVANHFGLTGEELLCKTRGSDGAARARMIAAWLLRKRLGLGFVEVGLVFGRSHSTILRAVERLGQEWTVSAGFRASVWELLTESERELYRQD